MTKYIFMINTTNKETLERGIIECEDKRKAKEHILKEYDYFFPSGKLFQRRKEGELVYVNIYELDKYWEDIWLREEKCEACGNITRKIDRKNMGLHSRYCSIICEGIAREISYSKQEKLYNTSVSYIYKITDKASGKSYVGKTGNHFIWRWWEHLKTDTGTKFSQFLKDASPGQLVFEIIEVMENSTEEEVLKKESYYIKKLDTVENGFNSRY